MSDLFLYEVEGGVATITMNRSDKKNAMHFSVLSEFIDTLRQARADEGALVFVRGLIYLTSLQCLVKRAD